MAVYVARGREGVSEQQHKVGDRVEVDLPGGTFTGTVRRVLPNYAWTERTWYYVTGKGFETTASDIRPVSEEQT